MCRLSQLVKFFSVQSLLNTLRELLGDFSPHKTLISRILVKLQTK